MEIEYPADMAAAKEQQPVVCAFCHRSTDDPIQYGRLRTTEGIWAHYYCILMSTDLLQNGDTIEGINGFLAEEIRETLNDSNSSLCDYCQLPNATLDCFYLGCDMQFHYPCGLEHGAGAYFVGDYRSYCQDHNHNARANRKRFEILNARGGPVQCIYCLEGIHADQNFYVTVCCRSCAMHTLCLKRHALAYGCFTRCPNCNSAQQFNMSIKMHGIYAPHRGAPYEINMQEIVQIRLVVQNCEVQPCRCPHGVGSSHSAMGGFCRLINCRMCGANPAHSRCKRTPGKLYLCSACRPVERRRRNLRRRIKPPQPEPPKNTRELRVVLERLDLDKLRALGYHIPCKYNLRSQKY